MADANTDRMRIDAFLYRARFFKTRAIASRAISGKGARIARDEQIRRTDKPSANIMPGDTISFSQAARVVTLHVLELPKRRGPAPEVQTCYELLDDTANQRG